MFLTNIGVQSSWKNGIISSSLRAACDTLGSYIFVLQFFFEKYPYAPNPKIPSTMLYFLHTIYGSQQKAMGVRTWDPNPFCGSEEKKVENLCFRG